MSASGAAAAAAALAAHHRAISDEDEFVGAPYGFDPDGGWWPRNGNTVALVILALVGIAALIAGFYFG